jgi:hypothetical protein
MHAHELIELAALVSAHGPVLVRTPGRISRAGIEEYWIASKSRLDRWGRSLKRFSTERADAGRRRPPSGSPVAVGVLEEIITGDMLTRVWTALMFAYDRFRGTDHVEPIARSVLVGQREARFRVLTLLAREPRIDAARAVKLDRLRRRTERWTDLLIGYLIGLDDVGQFAIDPNRARDFADDLRYRSCMNGGRCVWPLVFASLRASFAPGLFASSPNGDLNARIAASILSCLRPELLDATGLLRSAWLMRLSEVTDEAQGMIGELLSPHEPSSPGSPIRTNPSGRQRGFGM